MWWLSAALLLVFPPFFVSAWAEESCSTAFRSLAALEERPLFAQASLQKAPEDELRGVAYLSSSNLEREAAKLGGDVRAYLNPHGPLGYGQALGPFGPANGWGPVGGRPWNSSEYISGFDWSESARLLGSHGPLGPQGLYGPAGPASSLGKWLLKAFPGAEVFDEGGPLMVLGPKGILGPYGSLGGTGPVGATGLLRDPASGAAVRGSGQVVRSVTAAGKSLGLVERYAPDYAAALSKAGKLDGSFVLDQKVPSGKSVEYLANVKGGSWVSFLASPGGLGDRFDVELLSKGGVPIAVSDSKALVNFVSARFPADAQVIVRIKNAGPSLYNLTPLMPGLSMTDQFRLHVIAAPADAALSSLDRAHLTVLR